MLLRLVGLFFASLLLALVPASLAAAPAGDVATGDTVLPAIALPDLGEPLDTFAADLVPLTAPELATLAEDALRLAQQRTREVVDLRKTNPRLTSAEAPDAGQAQAIAAYDQRSIELVERRGQAFDRLRLVLDEWAEKGGDAETIAEYRAYRRAVISDTVENVTWGGAWSAIKAWAASETGGIRVLKATALFVALVIALFFLAGITSGLLRRRLHKKGRTSLLFQGFAGLVIYWLVVLAGLALITASFGFDITPAFALLGGVSFILAFALQETLGNFAAGLMILVYRPFDRGDRILAAGVDGTVRKVNIASTILALPEGQVAIVPNSKVWNDVILNAVGQEHRRVELSFVLADPRRANEVLEGVQAIIEHHPQVVTDPAPRAYVDALDGRGATLRVRPWVESRSFWSARRAVLKDLLAFFTEHDVKFWQPPIEERIGA